MHRETRQSIERLTARRDEAADALKAAEEALRDALSAALSGAERGDQAALVQITGYSREYLRRMSHVYYRSITRYDEAGAPLLKMPADNVIPDVTYEIRDMDRVTVVGHATGQELLNARATQLRAYLAVRPSGNIAMVDVSSFVASP